MASQGSGEETTGEVEKGTFPAPSTATSPGGVPCLTILSGTELGRPVLLHEGARLTVGRDASASLSFRDDSVSRRHAQITFREGCPLLVDLESKNGTFVNGERVSERVLASGDRVRLGGIEALRFAVIDENDAALQQQLYDGSTRDSLLGIFNAKHLEDRLREEVAFGRRHRLGLCVAILDVDRFKAINDLHGHAAGDAVLQSVAIRMRDALRAEDVLFRKGGDEFAVLLRNVDESGAVVCLERLRARVAETPVTVVDLGGAERKIPVSLSIGVAGLDGPGELSSPELLLSAADRALYEAKRRGRNSVVASRDAPAADPRVTRPL